MIELAAQALDKHDSLQEDSPSGHHSLEDNPGIGAVAVGLLIGINQEIGSNKISNILLNIRMAALNVCLLHLV